MQIPQKVSVFYYLRLKAFPLLWLVDQLTPVCLANKPNLAV